MKRILTAYLATFLLAGLASAQPQDKVKLDIGEIEPCAPGMGQGSSWACTDAQGRQHSCIKISCDKDCPYAADNVCYSDTPLVPDTTPKVPEYDASDRYVTSPTMLARAGVDGRIREIWSGMDSKRMRHIPLFLETTIWGQVRKAGSWLDLRTLKYHHDGTKPGFIRLASDDKSVTIEMAADHTGGPIFVKYSFAEPADFRLSAQFKYPWLTRSVQKDDSAGTGTFLTRWRGINTQIGALPGPRLVLATEPRGSTVSIDKTGLTKEIKSAKEVVLCIDATEPAFEPKAGQGYVSSWLSRLGGYPDGKSAQGLVSLASGDAKLDRLFSASLDAVETHQFESGDVMADLFFYRDSWLRDGTYSMIGLALAGDYAAVKRFFSFWTAQRDFSVGGEREAQQAAIGLTGLWFFSRLAPDGKDFLATVWPYVSYFADYFAKRVEKEGMLSLAEEWICFVPSPSSWPNAEVYSGLRASAKMAKELGKADEAKRWTAAADRLKEQFDAKAYDEGKGRIIPMAGPAGQSFTDPEYPKEVGRNGPLRDDRVDAGMLIIGRLDAFGKGQSVMPVDDPRFASTQDQVRRDLENPDHSIDRHGPNAANPHKPEGEATAWPIIVSWAAQNEWLLGRTDLAWRYLLSGIVNKAGYDAAASTYYLPENWDAKGFADKQLIVWSHGDFVTSTLLLFLGLDLEPQAGDIGLAPSLPPGMDHARIDQFRFRDWKLDFDLARAGAKVDVEMKATAKSEAAPLKIRLPSGEVLTAVAGQKLKFTVDPAQYYQAFGRSGHAAERLSIASRILTGKEPPKDPAKMTPAEQEAALLSIETGFAH